MLFRVAKKLQETPGSSMAAVMGTLNDAGMHNIFFFISTLFIIESMVALKDLMNRFNSEHVYTEEEFPTESGGSDLR